MADIKQNKMEILLAYPEIHNAEKHDMETLRKIGEYVITVLEKNKENVEAVSNSIRESHKKLFLMNECLFYIGIITVATTIFSGFSGKDVTTTLVFAGLSATSFLSFFLTTPLRAIEKTEMFSSWLTILVNSYFTEFAYFYDYKTAYTDIKHATDDFTNGMNTLIDKYMVMSDTTPAGEKSPANASRGTPPAQHG